MPEIPFALQWTIAENELLHLKDSINGCLSSTPVSNIPEFEYYLYISPNGDNDERRGKTVIFLCLEFKNFKKVEADFTFTIESANFSKANHYVYEESYGWGIVICFTKEFFDAEKNFIVDGKFTVKVDGIFKFDTALPAAIDAGKQTWIGGELGDEFWEKDDTKDFTITVEGKEIKVHKFILSSRSDFFAAMFKSNMKESIENKVEIPNFPFNIVETALKIIYNCSFTTKLSMNELMLLLQFFDQYQLLALKVKVESYWIAQISASTVCRLTNCSVKTNSFKLKEKCMEFLSVAFAAKTALSDIDDLEKDTIITIIKNSFYQTLEIRKGLFFINH